MEDLNALLQKIDADWELRFTLNYFLRKDKFDEQPYQKFIKTLNEWQQP